MGPQPVNQSRSPERTRAAAEAAGLEVLDLRSCALRVEFFDVGAVVHFLRKVHWTVPGFTPEGYRDRLRTLHEQITGDGVFVSTAQRAGRGPSPAPRAFGGANGQLAWLTVLML